MRKEQIKKVSWQEPTIGAAYMIHTVNLGVRSHDRFKCIRMVLSLQGVWGPLIVVGFDQDSVAKFEIWVTAGQDSIEMLHFSSFGVQV